MRHRVVPAKAERWQQLINGISLHSRQQKGNDAGRNNSTYCATVPAKDAVRLPVLYLRVRRPHFDCHPHGTLEAGKLRAQGNSVKSRVAPECRESIDRFAAGFALRSLTNQRRDPFFVFPRTRVFLFFSQDIFLFAIKNKILFFSFFSCRF